MASCAVPPRPKIMIRLLEAEARARAMFVAGGSVGGEHASLEFFALQSVGVVAGNRDGFDSMLAKALIDELRRRLGQVKERDARNAFSMGGERGENGSGRSRHESQGLNSSKSLY